MEEEAALRAKIQAMKNLLQVRAQRANVGSAPTVSYAGDSGLRAYRSSPYPSSSGSASRDIRTTYYGSTRRIWPPRNANVYRSHTYVRPAVVSTNKVWRKDMQGPVSSSTPEATTSTPGSCQPQTTSAWTKRVRDLSVVSSDGLT